MYSDISKSYIAFSDTVPEYGAHVADNIITLDGARMMFVLQLSGLSFNTLGRDQIDLYGRRLNSVLLSMGNAKWNDVSVWTHMIKRRITANQKYEFDTEFMRQFNERYIGRFSNEKYFETRYYLSFVVKYEKDIETTVRDLQRFIRAAVSATQEGLGGRALGLYKTQAGGTASEIGGFLNYLASGADSEIPLVSTPMVELIDQGAAHFGYDLAEMRASNGSQKTAIFYDLRTHPAKGKDGQWDFMLDIPAEFIFSQSFQFWSQNQSLKLLETQINKTSSVKSPPEDLIQELQIARNHVSSGNIVFGEHQGALVVFGDSLMEADDLGGRIEGAFSHGAGVLRRANLTAINTYLSLFPGSKHRPFREPKTTRNLVCGFSCHTHPQGKATKNPMGDGTAILPLSTDDGGIFNYNLQPTPIGKDSRGEMAAGHSLSVGMTGAGKSVFEAIIACYAARFGCAFFGIDYKESMINTFRGPLRGEYFRIRNGEPTGLNPFQWEDSEGLRAFLYNLVGTLAGQETTAEEHAQIKIAVDTVMRFKRSDRRLWHVQRNIPDVSGGNSLRTRLARWVEGGQYGWALDNPTSEYDPFTMFRVAFDATDLLVNDNPPSEPILATLFYMKEIIKGRVKGHWFITMVAEFWAPGNYPSTAAHMEDILRAGRLEGEIMMLSTQTPESAFNCMISDAVRQQTVTKNWLPNTHGKWESYKGYLTRAEFDKLLELSVDSRKILIKQGSESALVNFDLYGFDEFLPIVSSSNKSIAEVDALIEELGTSDSDVWLPEYMRRHAEKQVQEDEEYEA